MSEPVNDGSGEFKSDHPIVKRSEDAFDRADYASRVAETICNRNDPSSLVVAIHAPWGDGKTSVMAMAKEDLDTKVGIVTVWFNPWNFSNSSELIKGLFDTIAEALKRKLSTKAEAAFQAISRYGMAAGVIGGLFGQAETIKNVTEAVDKFSSVDLATEKGRVVKILEEEKQHVVIFVDDIDRLDKSEIFSIFKLIKLTGDFDYMTYVLAFDDEIVAQALNERYGGAPTDAGRRFLEKIIQVPLRLPPIRPDLLRKYAFNQIDEVMKDTKIEMPEKQLVDFVNYYIKGLEVRVSSPRLAKLYANSMRFSAPLILGELNLSDFMLFEGVKILYPSLYNSIKDNREIFLNPFQTDGNMSYDYADKVKGQIDQMLSDYTKDERSSAESLLVHLFPRLSGVYRRTFAGSDFERQWSIAKRLCSFEYFDKYIHYTIASYDVSDTILNKIIKTARDGSQAQLNEKIAEVMIPGKLHSLIKRLRSIEDTASIDAVKAISYQIAKNSELLKNEEGFMSFAGTKTQAAIFISKVIERIADYPERKEYSNRLIEYSTSKSFAFDLVHWLSVPKEDNGSGGTISESDITEMENNIVKKVLEIVSSEDPVKVFGVNLSNIGYYMKKYGDADKYRDSIMSSIESKPEIIIDVLKSYSGTMYNMTTGDKGRKSFGKESYDNLTELLDSTLLASIIRSTFSSMIEGKTLYDADLTENQALIIQFLQHYNKNA